MTHILKPLIVKTVVDLSHLKNAVDTCNKPTSKKTAQSICCVYKYVVASHLFVFKFSILFQYRFTLIVYYAVRVAEYNIIKPSYFVTSRVDDYDNRDSYTELTDLQKLNEIIHIIFARDVWGIYQRTAFNHPS